jgi:valyl-tRNA synthetase
MTMVELDKRYEPKEAESRWYPFWESRGYFWSDPDDRKPFTIVIPPPNVTGALHMGHALNNTLQDILVRWRRMQGYNSLWVPGTDHAGIATQAVVERRLLEQEGKTRHDVGRDGLLQRIWAWKGEYEQRILNQLRRLGCSCDWRRTRFTLDEICSRAVRETFFRLFRDGLIYRGKRLVNWDTHLQTAIADDEIFYETVPGKLWVLKYPLKEPVAGCDGLCVATTRPETMLGDTAVAVHPDDPRYRSVIGKAVILPLLNREIPVIADPVLVDPTFGTGCVKITPAHDPNDYAAAQRHGLPMINILNPDGTINANGGPYAGLDRYVARQRVVEDLERLGYLVEVKDYEVQLAHSDRSKTPIEPYLSDQWFVRMAPLAEQAIRVAESGEVRFVPARYGRTYIDWLAEKRDWCISRQLWWGHRIPVWTRDLAPEQLKAALEELRTAPGGPQACIRLMEAESGRSWAFEELRDPRELLAEVEQLGQRQPVRLQAHVCLKCDEPLWLSWLEAHGYRQDPDVLDTWFSSALWPHATLGWPEDTAELRYYYPTDVLVTSRDIITLWVARMVMMGLYNCGKVPFWKVYIHPKILDGFGQTMSKSKGNGVDPLDIIDRYGVDALRFTLTLMTTETQDVRLPVGYECPFCGNVLPQRLEHQQMKPKDGRKPRLTCSSCKKDFQFPSPHFDPDPGEPVARIVSEKFELGRNFANKLWNAARFSLQNLGDYQPIRVDVASLPFEDRWILGELSDVARKVTEHLEAFRFSDVARSLYDFTWGQFCDWYVEMVKLRLRAPEARPQAQGVLATVLDGILRLLHPVAPFVTEHLWQALGQCCPRRGLPVPETAAESVMVAPWPVYPDTWLDLERRRQMEQLQGLIRAVRNLKTLFQIELKQPVDACVRTDSPLVQLFRANAHLIQALAGVGELVVGTEVQRPPQAAAEVAPAWELYVPLQGLIDRDKEVRRLEKRREELRRLVQSIHRKLMNEDFLTKAPADVVERERERVAELTEQLNSLEAFLNDLGART